MAQAPTVTFTRLNDTLLTQSQYNDADAPGDQISYYRVMAVDEAGNESAPRTDSAFRPAPGAAPAVPSQLEATPSQTGIALDWANNERARPGRLQRLPRREPHGDLHQAQRRPADATSQYNDTQAPAGVDSYYRVTAVDQTGNESGPATDSARRPAPSDTMAPTASLGTTPANNARVRATVTLSANATDNVGVERVEFLVDGNVVGTDQSAPTASTGTPRASRTAARRSPLAPSTSRQPGNLGHPHDGGRQHDPVAPVEARPGNHRRQRLSNTDDVDQVHHAEVQRRRRHRGARRTIELFEGATLKGTTRVASERHLEHPPRDVTTGVHNYATRLTDRVGNTSPLSEPLSVTVDRQAPTVTNLTPALGSTTRVRRPTIGAIVDDDQVGGLTKSDVTLSWTGVR